MGNNHRDSTLLDALNKRQEALLSLLPSYFKIISLFAIYLYLMSAAFRLLFTIWHIFHQNKPHDIGDVLSLLFQAIGLSSLQELNVGAIISTILTIFSGVIIWLFILWSLSFIPYLAINSYRASRDSYDQLSTRTRFSRWIQLFAATFLPMVVFAIAWNSLSHHQGDITLQVRSGREIIGLVGGTIFTVALLLGMNYLILMLSKKMPHRASSLLPLQLTVFSLLVYSSLLIAYGIGYSVASFAVLLGIFMYLMFASDQIQEIGKEIVIYDIEPSISKEIARLKTEAQALGVAQEEASLFKLRNEVLGEHAAAKRELAEANVERQLQQQISNIRAQKAQLTRKAGEVHLKLIEQQIRMLNEMLDITQGELSAKIELQVSQSLKALEREASELPLVELYDRVRTLIDDLNQAYEDLPHAIEEITQQLRVTTDRMEEQARKMLEESTFADGKALVADGLPPKSTKGDK